MGNKSTLERDSTVSLENLGNEIRRVSQLGKAINASNIKRKGVTLLLSEMTGVKRGDINTILDNLPLLEKEYLKP